jgi:hypothetical protein
MTQQNNIDNDVLKAWREAAIDLGLKIHSPFILKIDTGEELEYGMLIENFAGDQGVLVLTEFEKMDDDEPEMYGYCSSALAPEYYEKYDRESFIETLTEWGYYGAVEDKPNWYTGHLYILDK